MRSDRGGDRRRKRASSVSCLQIFFVVVTALLLFFLPPLKLGTRQQQRQPLSCTCGAGDGSARVSG
jgi:hypothetical protein